ncbi:Exo_endo_phos domain-containing protein [Cucumis melo var. makuwa]|uniref:Exo_endo_phos domain-containing protein n=1 Tax=Cucumis melo var. makuwa TaxID=1194695 RepID=A0A5A7VQP1_CUCMM|nr:Exo_endo_phos domain-containing protein [Cucumis melo var. makuwa]
MECGSNDLVHLPSLARPGLTKKVELGYPSPPLPYDLQPPRVVLGDFNAITLHSKAFCGSSIPTDIKEFDIAIREADLVKPLVSRVSVLSWGISDHSSILVYPGFQQSQRVVTFRFFNYWVEDPSFIDVVPLIYVQHGGIYPSVGFITNLHDLKPALCR